MRQLIDIFESGLDIDNRIVTIVGSGPNGAAHFGDIPPDSYKIAVNYSITAPIDFDMWGVVDYRCLQYDWFWESLKSFDGVKVFEENIHEDAFVMPETYSVKMGRGLSLNEHQPIKNVIRTRSTVSGSMLQLVYHIAKRPVTVLLCGVDMKGNTYYDGSTNSDAKNTRFCSIHGGFSRMIESMQSDRFRVYTLSPTLLRVPLWEQEDDQPS